MAHAFHTTTGHLWFSLSISIVAIIIITGFIISHIYYYIHYHFLYQKKTSNKTTDEKKSDNNVNKNIIFIPSKTQACINISTPSTPTSTTMSANNNQLSTKPSSSKRRMSVSGHETKKISKSNSTKFIIFISTLILFILYAINCIFIALHKSQLIVHYMTCDTYEQILHILYACSKLEIYIVLLLRYSNIITQIYKLYFVQILFSKKRF